MSQRKPHSLLSFIYHATFEAPYRQEMHTDMEVSFRRFGVADPSAQLSCYGIEKGAYLRRDSSDDVAATGKRDGMRHNQGLAQIDQSTEVLFDQLELELSKWVRSGAPPAPNLARAIDFRAPETGPARGSWPTVSVSANNDVQVASGGLLLEYVYFFFSFPAARAAISRQMQVVGAIRHLLDQKAVVDDLTKLGKALDAPGKVAYSNEVRRLCAELRHEYATRSWFVCW